MTSNNYSIPPDTRRSRADKVLAKAFPDHSRAAWQRAFEAGLVLRGGRPLDKNDTVAPGDEIEYSFPDVVVSALEPNPIRLDILFEDKNLLAVNKPAGMVVHPGAGTGGDTLVHALLAHCRGSLSGVGGVERPGIVHRLDRETSGVMLVAKNDKTHRGLAEQFAQRTTEKEYLALVGNSPDLIRGSIHKPIGRHPTQRHKMSVADEGARGRDAWTDWMVEERFGKRATLLRCILHTGRTHQIRVHLKFLGYSILGDKLYGGKYDTTGLPIERTLLHAERLAVIHPITKKRLEIRAPLPADFQAVLKALRKVAPVSKPAPRVMPRAHVREKN